MRLFFKMESERIKAWHVQADTQEIMEHYLDPTLSSVRALLKANAMEVYSYTIPLRENKGAYHIVFCRCPTRKQNPFLGDFKSRMGLSCWPETIYGDALILYSRQSQVLLYSYMEGSLSCSGYASIPYFRVHEAISFINQYKLTEELHNMSVRSQEFNEAMFVPEPMYAAPRPVPSVQTPRPSAPNASSFLMKMALKGLLAEKTTCPITLEELSEYKEVQMFLCGHACSPQSVYLDKCPVCREKTSFIHLTV